MQGTGHGAYRERGMASPGLTSIHSPPKAPQPITSLAPGATSVSQPSNFASFKPVQQPSLPVKQLEFGEEEEDFAAMRELLKST